MTTPREPLRFLSSDEMETLHRNVLRILAEVGMRVDHDEALDYLRAAGCRVDGDKRQVLFPVSVVQKYVDKMRSDFAKRRYPEKVPIRYSHIRLRKEDFRIHPDFSVNTGGFCLFVHGLDGVRRRGTLRDTRDSIRLAAQLDQITYTGIPVVPEEIPAPILRIRMVAELVKITDKLGGIEALNKFDIEYIARIGEVIRGSSEELKRNPILIGYGEARTPLSIDNNMCDILIEYVKRGLPQSLDTMPNAGATAPMHPAGALAVGLAETLGGMVLAYAVDEDACVTIDVTPGFADMRTGVFRYAGAERVPLIGARIQMISEYYGCPSGVHGGKTDSCMPGIRCGVEKGISMLMPVLCGAVGFGTVGHIENATTFSPVQLVIDNEIVRYVRKAVHGFSATDETINVDLIKRVGIGGNYLQEPETAAAFRECMNLSPFFEAYPWEFGEYQNTARRMENMAAEKAHELLNNEIEPPLTDDQIKEIDKIVAEAEAKLAEQGDV